MLPFSTEFPVVSGKSRADFVAEVVVWLRGIQGQTVLSDDSEKELDKTNVYLRANSGEELRIRELQSGDNLDVVGMRHDFPDISGRIWRTECVLKRFSGDEGQDLLRLRTQCLASKTGARIESPRKPYLIKALLKDGWGGRDRQLTVSDQPTWLKSDKDGLLTAKEVTLGRAARWLPIIYISTTNQSYTFLTRDEIEKLAYDLGGISHVVVEPNRSFSLKLRDITEAQNVYGGAIGLAVPEQGIIRRYYLGWQIQDRKALADAVKAAAIGIRSKMPALGLDWVDLQEQILREQRERDRNKLDFSENEKLYNEEIENLKEQLTELKQQIIEAHNNIPDDDSEFSIINLVKLIGPEIYTGEISDRILFAARRTLLAAPRDGIDGRSIAILKRIVEKIPGSPARSELSKDISRATKDPKRAASQLIVLLKRHGYSEKSDNKHIRLEANTGFDGLCSITLPKTPSDQRGLKNICKQIERTLGITKLDK